MTVREALDRELAEMGAVADSALAATARRLADDLDGLERGLPAVPSTSKELRAVMAELRELAPAGAAKGGSDDLKTRRDARRRAVAETEQGS